MSNKFSRAFFVVIMLCYHAAAQKSVVDALITFSQKRGIDSEESQKYWQRGFEDFQQQDYQKAAENFGQAALASPRNPLANLYLGCSLFALKHYSLAGKVMRRVATLYPDWENLPINFPKLFPQKNDFRARLADFEDWAFRESKNANVYFLLGFLYQFSGESRKAEASYRVAVSCDPLCREAYEFLSMLQGRSISPLIPLYDKLSSKGQKLLKQQQYLKAVDIWSTACIEYPDKTEALFFLGYSLTALGRFKEGSRILQVAISKSPGMLKQQMRIQAKMQQNTSWLTSLEEHFRDKDQGFDITFLLSYFYVLIGESEKARNTWKHANKITPESFELKELRKMIDISAMHKTAKKDGKTDEKTLVFMKSEEAKEKLLEGEKLFYQQKYQKAAQVFSRRVMDFPNDKKSQWLLGLTTFATGQYPYTYKFFKALLPQASVLTWQLYYAKPEHLEKQMEKLAKWLRKYPDDNAALFVQGVMLLGISDKKKAYRVFSKLKKRLPEDLEVEYGYQLAQKLPQK